MPTLKVSFVAAIALLVVGVSYAATEKSTAMKSAGDALVLASPPRESAEEAQRLYQPLADYLGKVLGKRVVYKYPRTWGVYRTEMLAGNYDIVFDGPHFNGYRVEKLKHNVLVKLPEVHEFTIIVRKDDKAGTATDLNGRTVCSQSPPNLGALVLLSQFEKSGGKPVLIPTKGWDKIYDGVVSGRCNGGVLPFVNLKKLDKDGMAKIVYKHKGLPNQAISAGPRLSAQEQAKLASALMSPEGVAATAKLREAFKTGQLVAASNTEYTGLGNLLRHEWGFYSQ